MKTLFVVIVFIGLAFNACADDKIFLCGDYYYGMSYEDFIKTGSAQCDDYPDGDKICNRQRIIFAGRQWTQFFEFKNNKLNCVSFGQPLSLALFSAAMNWFQDENYVPLKATAGRGSVNFLNLYNKEQNKEFEEEANQFNLGLPYADTFTSYLIKQSTLDELKTMDRLPADAVITSFAASKRQGLFFVTFELAKNIKISSIK